MKPVLAGNYLSQHIQCYSKIPLQEERTKCSSHCRIPSQNLQTLQAVKLPFVQCSNFARRMGNVNAISTEQRLAALGEDSWGNPLEAPASVISLSEIYESSGWLFHPTTHSGCSISLSSDPYKAHSGYSLWPQVGLVCTRGYLHLMGSVSSSHLSLPKHSFEPVSASRRWLFKAPHQLPMSWPTWEPLVAQ